MLLGPDEQFKIIHGDCIEHMHTMPAESVEFSIFSPPFPSTFSYTSSEKDIGNSEDLDQEVKLHFGFFFAAIRPLIKPGRVMMVHCAQIPYLKRSGGEGTFNFRDFLIRSAKRKGFIYEYDWVIRKNPQAQALRTKKWELKFQGLETDRAQSRGAMPDFMIKFRAPGINKVPVDSPGEVERNDWIQWAEAAWMDIKETATLNAKAGNVDAAKARGEDDTRHICPLQLPLINRYVRLYTNPGELVFSPFAGIGSELYESLKLGRRAFGCELKDEYHAAAVRNCNQAVEARKQSQQDLWSLSNSNVA